ncbi:MAG: 3-methyl-2-oxobutanoate dehydrogenase [Deltaproteobacteria bacterium]|nr:MAG: 3-methyl-2-oxobutanoate dehydrogenase [Deltaproteobacteria bacterium]
MVLVRALDERMMTLQRQGRIGFYGAHTGQEAVPVAAAEALSPEDWIFPALREGPIMLHRGFDLFTYVSQIFGNAADLAKGRNMPSHMAARAVRQVSWSSVIGPQITQAAGAAYAAKIRAEGTLAVAFMGDGATSSADFHTGLNFASVWQAPALFICQNNQWSISVPTNRQTGSKTIAQKAVAYGLPGYQVDGNDALAVYAAVAALARRARRGEGPAFLECLTYRIGAHSSSDDPRVYRDEREVEVWKARDPILRLERFLLDAKVLRQAQVERLAEEAAATVADAVRRAEAEPPPPRETLFDDVYAARPWHLEEQARELFAVARKGG